MPCDQVLVGCQRNHHAEVRVQVLEQERIVSQDDGGALNHLVLLGVRDGNDAVPPRLGGGVEIVPPKDGAAGGGGGVDSHDPAHRSGEECRNLGEPELVVAVPGVLGRQGQGRGQVRQEPSSPGQRRELRPQAGGEGQALEEVLFFALVVGAAAPSIEYR